MPSANGGSLLPNPNKQRKMTKKRFQSETNKLARDYRNHKLTHHQTADFWSEKERIRERLGALIAADPGFTCSTLRTMKILVGMNLELRAVPIQSLGWKIPVDSLIGIK